MGMLDGIGVTAGVDDVLAVMRGHGIEPTRDGALILLDRHVSGHGDAVRAAALAARPDEPCFSDEMAARERARREVVEAVLSEAGIIPPAAGAPGPR